MNDRIAFPSVRYHPVCTPRIVNDGEEEALLRAECELWRDEPYPAPVVIPPPPEPTVEELKAANAELVDKIATLTADLKCMTEDRDNNASDAMKLVKELQKARAALKKAEQPKPEAKADPKPAEEPKPAE